MKKLISMIVLFLVGQLHAAAIFCGEADKGYNLGLNSSHQEAELRVNGRSIKYGELGCVAVFPAIPRQDGKRPLASCRSVSVKDAGYRAFVYRTKSTFNKIRADLSKVTKMGSKIILTIDCVTALE